MDESIGTWATLAPPEEPYALLKKCGCTWARVGSGLWVACPVHAKAAEESFNSQTGGES